MKCNFTYDTINLVKLTLQIYIDKHNKNEPDASKRMASNEMIYNKIEREEIIEVLNEWSEKNNNKIKLFENGIKDAKEIWYIIWEKESYKELVNKHICLGHSGTGVFDKSTKIFMRCGFAEHYETIKTIVKEYHKNLWEEYNEFIHEDSKECKNLDDFIMNNIVLIGNLCEKENYKVSVKKC